MFTDNVIPTPIEQSNTPIPANININIPNVTPENNRLTPLTVSFQVNDDEPSIPPNALETWRLCRSHLSAEARSRARAQHLRHLSNQGLLPHWSIGLAAIPTYLEEVADELVQLKKSQAHELLNKACEVLTTSAQQHRESGLAHRNTCKTIYGNNTLGLSQADFKLKQLIERDRQTCTELLQRRVEAIQANPVDSNTVVETLIYRPADTLNSRRGRGGSRHGCPHRGIWQPLIAGVPGFRWWALQARTVKPPPGNSPPALSRSSKVRQDCRFDYPNELARLWR